MLSPRSALLVLTFLLTVGCDYGTKGLAKAHLEGQNPVELVPGVFALRYAENSDTAFSLIGDLMSPAARHVALSALAGLATVVLGFALARAWRRLGALQRFGASMILAGAVGNATERAIRGYVIDFFHVSFWPVFNVADIAIVVGVALFLLSDWASRRPSRFQSMRAHDAAPF